MSPLHRSFYSITENTFSLVLSLLVDSSRINVIYFRCEVGESGAVWRLQNTMAACLTFPQNAVKTTVVFQCILRQSTTDFQPLRKNEALVSNVIVLACDDPLGSEFNGHFDEKVSVALSHSAANLQGYEVVMKELVDTDNNVWKDLKTTNIWKTSGKRQF